MNPAPPPYVQPGGVPVSSNVVYPGNVIAAPSTVTQVQVQRQPWSTSIVIARKILWMGVLQLALGVASIIFNMGGNIQSVNYLYVGPGYWCGLPYIICGVMGIIGGVKRSKGFIVAFLTLSVVCTVLTIGIIATTAVGLGDYRPGCQYRSNYHNGYYDSYLDCSNRNPTLAWNSLLLIAGLIEFVISIVAACLCCGALCGRDANAQFAGQVHYVNGSPHMIINGQILPATFVSQPIQYTGQPVVNTPIIVAGQPGPAGQIVFQGAQIPAQQFQQPGMTAPVGSAPFQQAQVESPPPYTAQADPTHVVPAGVNQQDVKY